MNVILLALVACRGAFPDTNPPDTASGDTPAEDTPWEDTPTGDTDDMVVVEDTPGGIRAFSWSCIRGFARGASRG